MLCLKPARGKVLPFPCGQCLPCKINNRRLWTWRQLLESCCHHSSIFVTLTYDDEHLPEGATLKPEDLQLWLKRIRERLAPIRFRFLAVGEYGDERGRPHYHLSMFGLDTTVTEDINLTWKKGNIDVQPFSRLTAQYVVGYVVKKMTDPNDARLQGRFPEFSRQSNRPGIGANAADAIFRSSVQAHRHQSTVQTGPTDAPHVLQLGKQKFPVARYIRGKVQDLMQLSDAQRDQNYRAFILRKVNELSALRSHHASIQSDKTFSQWHREHVYQQRANTIARHTVYKKRVTL